MYDFYDYIEPYMNAVAERMGEGYGWREAVEVTFEDFRSELTTEATDYIYSYYESNYE